MALLVGRGAVHAPIVVAAALAAGVAAGPTPPGEVFWHQKISATQGGFAAVLDDFDLFGVSVAPVGDLDGDGSADLAAGASADDDGGPNRGAVYVLFLAIDGQVQAHAKISATEGRFTGSLDDHDQFGFALAFPGDLDGDAVGDLVAAAPADDDGGPQHGALWVLFLNADGTVKAHQKISQLDGGFAGVLDDFDHFGWSVTALGDLDGDGVTDLAAGAPFDDDGGPQRGAVWILFMNADGTVEAHRKISSAEGGLTDPLADADLFGTAVSGLGDLDGDGIADLAVGSGWVNDGGTDRGAVWVLFLNADGTVRDHVRISDTTGGFTGTLDNSDFFGGAVAALDDLDGDAVADLAAGARGDDDGGTNHGAVWVLFMNADGTVKAHAKISDTAGSFTGTIDGQDEFASALAWLGDPDGDGSRGLAVGAYSDDDGGIDHGAAWLLFLGAVPGCASDCTGDAAVGTADLLALLAEWGTSGACDLDGSGTVGTTDLLVMLADWGPCPQ